MDYEIREGEVKMPEIWVRFTGASEDYFSDLTTGREYMVINVYNGEVTVIDDVNEFQDIERGDYVVIESVKVTKRDVFI